MLKRKTAPSKALNSRRASGKSAKPKAAPVRRRFIISSKAKKDLSKPEEANGKAKHTAGSIADAEKRLQNGHANGNGATPAPGAQPSVDLTETIKTLLHLAQEH